MFVRGTDQPIEYNRIDNNFYKGIVVRNDDPLQMFRVKVYIPELSNQPYKYWLQDKANWEIKFPGDSSGRTRGEAWESDGLFWEVAKYLPWAEASFPLVSESVGGNYFAGSVWSRSANITDAIHHREHLDTQFKTDSWGSVRGPDINEGHDDKPMTHDNRSTAPSYAYEDYETLVCDDHTNPVNSYSLYCNPFAYEYRPVTYSNKPKGMFGTPSVGAKVWVFHYNGDINQPVYFGIRYDAREAAMINDTDDTVLVKGPDYPMFYENSHPRQFDPHELCGAAEYDQTL